MYVFPEAVACQSGVLCFTVWSHRGPPQGGSAPLQSFPTIVSPESPSTVAHHLIVLDCVPGSIWWMWFRVFDFFSFFVVWVYLNWWRSWRISKKIMTYGFWRTHITNIEGQIMLMDSSEIDEIVREYWDLVKSEIMQMARDREAAHVAS
jgi:hypothetical protein